MTQIYGAAGVAFGSERLPHGPTLFSQIVDTPADAAAPGSTPTPAGDIAPRDRVPASDAPPDVKQVRSSQHLDGLQAAANPAGRTAPAAPQQDSPMFGAVSCVGAKSGEVLWDPGPLVPVDDPPPYEPLVAEETAC